MATSGARGDAVTAEFMAVLNEQDLARPRYRGDDRLPRYRGDNRLPRYRGDNRPVITLIISMPLSQDNAPGTPSVLESAAGSTANAQKA